MESVGAMLVTDADVMEAGGQFEGCEPGWYYYRIGQPADEPIGPYETEEAALEAGRAAE